ncbi:hypothetical protein [Kitasatospora sp. NPDC086791]|uniref:hypothetical protein n=1 Tax=Kitasatospora sp. NPDC086791 TaxID=3155178 RepID=UPI0034427E9E
MSRTLDRAPWVSGAHRRHQRHRLRRRVGSAAVAGPVDPQPVGDQARQTEPLGQADQRDQARVRDQIRLVEHGGDGRYGVRGLHFRDALLIVLMERRELTSSQVARHLFVPAFSRTGDQPVDPEDFKSSETVVTL